MKFYYPVKPYKVNQKWGVYRPEVYSQFGFTQHNGEDIALGTDKCVYAPFDCGVLKIGNQPNGGGIFCGVISTEQTEKGRVLLDILHCEKILCEIGKTYKAGDKLNL